jgi:hypothetical protein
VSVDVNESSAGQPLSLKTLHLTQEHHGQTNNSSRPHPGIASLIQPRTLVTKHM